MTSTTKSKVCDLCHVATAYYNENEYTNLCLGCWSIVRVNQGIEAVNHPTFHIWQFERSKYHDKR